MEPALVVFLAGVGLLVLALAIYLTVVVIKLRAVIATLERVVDGIDHMGHQTEPVGELVERLQDAVGSSTPTSGDGHG